jgi:hypothetical protein
LGCIVNQQINITICTSVTARHGTKNKQAIHAILSGEREQFVFVRGNQDIHV